jgi:hypothetical protein
VNYNVDKEHEEEIELYTIISGRIQEDFISLLNNYDISDPNSEKVLEHCQWEDYRNLSEYKNSIVKNSDYYRIVTASYDLDDLDNSINKFTTSKQYY